MKTRKLYRIRLASGSHNYVVGWGDSIPKVVEAFKREIDGYCFNQVFQSIERLNEEKGFKHSPVSAFGTQEKVGIRIEWQKEFLRNNCSLNYEVFYQEFDEEKCEWISKNQEFWCPKYNIKF